MRRPSIPSHAMPHPATLPRLPGRARAQHPESRNGAVGRHPGAVRAHEVLIAQGKDTPHDRNMRTGGEEGDAKTAATQYARATVTGRVDRIVSARRHSYPGGKIRLRSGARSRLRGGAAKYCRQALRDGAPCSRRATRKPAARCRARSEPSNPRCGEHRASPRSTYAARPEPAETTCASCSSTRKSWARRSEVSGPVERCGSAALCAGARRARRSAGPGEATSSGGRGKESTARRQAVKKSAIIERTKASARGAEITSRQLGQREGEKARRLISVARRWNPATRRVGAAPAPRAFLSPSRKGRKRDLVVLGGDEHGRGDRMCAVQHLTVSRSDQEQHKDGEQREDRHQARGAAGRRTQKAPKMTDSGG